MFQLFLWRHDTQYNYSQKLTLSSIDTQHERYCAPCHYTDCCIFVLFCWVSLRWVPLCWVSWRYFSSLSNTLKSIEFRSEEENKAGAENKLFKFDIYRQLTSRIEYSLIRLSFQTSARNLPKPKKITSIKQSFAIDIIIW
jgi:hypothetical protein